MIVIIVEETGVQLKLRSRLPSGLSRARFVRPVLLKEEKSPAMTGLASEASTML